MPMLHDKYPLLQQRKLDGDFKHTKEEALESANLAALVYLRNASIIFVDEINLTELIKCEAWFVSFQRRLLAASSCARTCRFFED